jgi:hypothetical protein
MVTRFFPHSDFGVILSCLGRAMRR